MNKKFAMLMFALGVGTASAPAFAALCEVQCSRNFSQCRANPLFDYDYCYQAYENCLTICS